MKPFSQLSSEEPNKRELDPRVGEMWQAKWRGCQMGGGGCSARDQYILREDRLTQGKNDLAR